tara:strand:- start:682 stop:1155 length:474 start_codon:yes stop_codon:yes gene_type:complete
MATNIGYELKPENWGTDAQRTQKQYAKEMFEKMAQGNLGRDEGAALQKAQTDAANQAIQAQQTIQKQQAMAYGQGDPTAAGASVKAAQAASKAAADAAIESTGAAKDYQQKVFETQQALAMEQMGIATQAELEKRAQDMELAGGMLEVAGQLVPTLI